MKQQVNFYLPQFHKQRVAFPATQLFSSLILIIMVLAGIYYYNLYKIQKPKKMLTQLQAQELQAVQELEKIEQAQIKQNTSQLLEREYQNLVKEQKSWILVSKTLSGDDHGNTHGFSEHLKAISRQMKSLRSQQSQHMWLTLIKFAKEGQHVGFEGKTDQPALVPKFLSSLTQEAAFTGNKFEVFQMYRSETQPNEIDFAIYSKLKKETEGGAESADAITAGDNTLADIVKKIMPANKSINTVRENKRSE